MKSLTKILFAVSLIAFVPLTFADDWYLTHNIDGSSKFSPEFERERDNMIFAQEHPNTAAEFARLAPAARWQIQEYLEWVQNSMNSSVQPTTRELYNKRMELGIGSADTPKIREYLKRMQEPAARNSLLGAAAYAMQQDDKLD